MMRSLYSGVSGLKVHQTKMDVIGNNIANVNTVGFKSSNVNFSDVLYQTTQSASGANASTGVAGRNAKQIGIGSQVASITSTISSTGGTQRTDNALDCMISGDAFFIVNYGGQNYYTKAGSFNVDASGTLCTANGAAVMGWQVNSDGTDVIRTTVSKLTVMSPEKMSSEPEATTKAYITGNVDSSDPQLTSEDGVAMQVNFFDNLGNSYNMMLSMTEAAGEEAGGDTVVSPSGTGIYSVKVADIVDADGKSILYRTVQQEDGTEQLELTGINFTFAGVEYNAQINETNDGITFGDVTGATLAFDTATGAFKSITGADGAGADEGKENNSIKLSFGGADGEGEGNTGSPFKDVEIDFSTITQYAGSGKCSLESQRGSVDGSGKGAGRTMGEMTGLSIDGNGKIYGSYDNGTTKLLGQLAVTTFANATGLEAVGDSMFTTTQNSGDFDGIGKDVTEAGSTLTTGVLEMSNVDLSTEFTQMITTQRGFQSNSRIITTSDTMLEELINLKR